MLKGAEACEVSSLVSFLNTIVMKNELYSVIHGFLISDFKINWLKSSFESNYHYFGKRETEINHMEESSWENSSQSAVPDS